MLTVVAYLLSVSTVASTLSAYYIFVWNPYAANDTQTLNSEGMVMALRRDSDRYSGKSYNREIRRAAKCGAINQGETLRRKSATGRRGVHRIFSFISNQIDYQRVIAIYEV